MEPHSRTPGTTESRRTATKSLDIVAFVFRRVFYIIPLGVIVFLPLAFVATKLGSSYYEAEGTIRLSRASAPILTADEQSINTYYYSYMNTQVHYLKRPEIIKAALATLPPEQQELFPLTVVRRNLEVEPVPGTHLIGLKLKSEHREGLSELIEAIMACYIESVAVEAEQINTERLGFLRTEEARLANTLSTAQAELNAITQRLETGTFSEEFNPFRAKLKILQESYLAAMLERRAKENELNALLKGNAHALESRQTRERVQQVVAVAKETETQLKRDVDELLPRAAERSAELLNGEAIKTHVESIDQNLSRVRNRIFDLSLESKLPIRVSIANHSIPPEKPTDSSIPKLLAVCFLIAFGTVGALFFAYDALDDRIRTSEDLEHAIGVMPFRPIPRCNLKKSQALYPFARVTIDYPESVVAVAIRALAMRLWREHTERGARSAFFTGIDAGNGTTQVLLNVACTMTQFCEKILVVEANPHKPVMADIVLPGGKTARLQEHLSGKCTLDECVITDRERGIDVLPCAPGRTPDISSANFAALLDTLKTKYDFVLVDTPPVLGNDLPELMAYCADVGVIVVEGDYSFFQDVRLALDCLCRLEVPAVIAALNWGGHPPRPWLARWDKVFRGKA